MVRSGEAFAASKVRQEVFDKFAEAAELCAAAADPQQLWSLAKFTEKSPWFTESHGRCFKERRFVEEVVKCVVESCEITLSYCLTEVSTHEVPTVCNLDPEKKHSKKTRSKIYVH